MEDAHQNYLEDEIRRNALGIREMVEIASRIPTTTAVFSDHNKYGPPVFRVPPQQELNLVERNLCPGNRL